MQHIISHNVSQILLQLKEINLKRVSNEYNMR